MLTRDDFEALNEWFHPALQAEHEELFDLKGPQSDGERLALVVLEVARREFLTLRGGNVIEKTFRFGVSEASKRHVVLNEIAKCEDEILKTLAGNADDSFSLMQDFNQPDFSGGNALALKHNRRIAEGYKKTAKRAELVLDILGRVRSFFELPPRDFDLPRLAPVFIEAQELPRHGGYSVEELKEMGIGVLACGAL